MSTGAGGPSRAAWKWRVGARARGGGDCCFWERWRRKAKGMREVCYCYILRLPSVIVTVFLSGACLSVVVLLIVAVLPPVERRDVIGLIKEGLEVSVSCGGCPS